MTILAQSAFRILEVAGPEIFLITETLWLKILTSSRLFQTQLLKLYFLTTLYVDVKEPAFTHISGDKKTQPRARFGTSIHQSGFDYRCRDKIESNLQSQMYV